MQQIQLTYIFAYRDLGNYTNWTTPDQSVLRQQLREIEYTMPQVRLKLTNGEQSKFVPYDEVHTMSSDWEVTGFRMQDQGSGFDYRLLGMIGASTKKESAGKRGGLGEGLKMSLAHLTRSGAKIRIASRNRDQMWISKPQVSYGDLEFHGRQRSEREPDFTGSLTDVDFLSENVDSSLRTAIIDAIDPRKGEGLGKYILEFRGKEFLSVINNSTELDSHEVPPGRVYVKGLLVEEIKKLLFSYNLGEKWAISGRDRKTVKRDVLESETRRTIGSLKDTKAIGTVVQAMVEGNKYHELDQLDDTMIIRSDREGIWRREIETRFEFTPGKDLFADGYISPEAQRQAEAKGFVLKSFRGNANMMRFVRNLYPDHLILTSDLKVEQERVLERPLLLVDTELASTLERFKTMYEDLTRSYVLGGSQAAKIASTLYMARSNIPQIMFAQADPELRFDKGSYFAYFPSEDVIYVKEGVTFNFATITDLFAEFTKAADRQYYFDERSQAVVTSLAGATVAQVKPELVENADLPAGGYTRDTYTPTTYKNETIERDTTILGLKKFLNTLDTPEVTKPAVESALAEIKAKATEDETLLDGKNNTFFFEGKVYTINREYDLEEVKMVTPDEQPFRKEFIEYLKATLPLDEKTILDPQLLFDTIRAAEKESVLANMYKQVEAEYNPHTVRVLPPDASSYELIPGDNAFLPFQLANGESMTLRVIRGPDETELVLKREGDLITPTYTADGKTKVLNPKPSFYAFERGPAGAMISVSNNVLSFFSYDNLSLVVEKDASQKKIQLEEERNRGKEFLQSNITIDYGAEVWQDPKRVLLDAIQNHLDAQNNRFPTVSYTVMGSGGQIERLSKEELQERDNSWSIIGMEIADDGKGYPTAYLKTLGKSSKGDNDIGKFGEGLKMLLASSVRQGISVEVGSRDWIAEPTSYQQTVKDYETGEEQTFSLLGYTMQWQPTSRSGSFTKFSLLPLAPGQTQLSPEQKSEVSKRLLISESANTWQQWLYVLDPRNLDAYGQRGLDRYILSQQHSAHSKGAVTVLPDRVNTIFEKNLLIPGFGDEPLLFGYNINGTIINTRERNAYNQKLVDGYLKNYFRTLTDTTIMRKILETAKKDPYINYHEYKLLAQTGLSPTTSALWRQTYHEVFGNDAVLSLRPMQQKHGHGYYDLYVSNEHHLINRNLQILSQDLTDFLQHRVYSSRNYSEELVGLDIEIPATDKEKLVRFLQTANQSILTVLESLDSSPSRRNYLGEIVMPDVLAERKKSAVNNYC